MKATEDGDGGVPSRDNYFVMSLARGLNVLKAFTPERTELSLSEIAAVAGVTNPSALRIGHTLVELGFLTRNPLTKGYRVGPGVLTLGMASLSSMSLLEIAEPYLAQLRDDAGETVKLAVLHGNEMVYIGRFPSQLHPQDGSAYVGSRLPAGQTCTGRAILALLDEAEARRIVEGGHRQRFTDKSLVTVDEIMAELAATRERGFSVNDQGTTLEHRSAAAALVGPHGNPVGAINFSVSSQRVSVKELSERLVPMLLDTAGKISALLPPEPPQDVRPFMPRAPLASGG
ncbi:IclR family transcriptional regulator [Phytohabitans suffuscus]|uniref:IclR family transcriptional regulator n=1 Tax=Phytohabitans suffuscus TaxID=624315 RepID=A0A6F8YVE3_9ACTN|nr:IclR family transcriptional regulator [Phytohabitans suffuscus]BCB90026.1 IclR family transcriptional regulator [Phytohabitans suffuscus]